MQLMETQQVGTRRRREPCWFGIDTVQVKPA
jgi:hypothetical protein